ncbi:MAG: glycosyltransferase family 1 protein [Candidatus Doudnabacteria bacterium]
MKIGVDLRMIGGGSGIDRYITDLSHEILKQDKTNQYILFFRDIDKSANYKQYNQKIVIADIPHYSFAEQLKFPGILKREKLDLVHFPHFNVPLFYRRPFVVTIHDLTHTLFPGRKKSHFFHRIAYNLILRNAIRRSKKIIAVSNATKKSILEHFPIPADKINVVYEGISQGYHMLDKQEAYKAMSNKFGFSKPYILNVGVWRRYKNLPQLSLAFDILITKGMDLELVLVGASDPSYPDIAEKVLGIKNKSRVKVLGRVSDADLNQLYNGATLFVLPSLIEGFGLIALEAAACGIPVACSDIPTLREIMGQGAEYFDPENLSNMADVLYRLLQNPQRLEELANLALSRSRHFSWKEAAEQTIKLYNEVIGDRL